MHVQDKLGPKTEDERYAATLALFEVFGDVETKEDAYCLQRRFVARNISNYVDWEDIEIESTKLLRPAKQIKSEKIETASTTDNEEVKK